MQSDGLNVVCDYGSLTLKRNRTSEVVNIFTEET